MSELDLTNIAAASISTPASGVTATYVELTSPAKRLSTKNDAGTVINYIGTDTTDSLTNKSLVDASVSFVDNVDATKKLSTELSGNTTGITLTLAGTSTTSQTLSLPNIRQAETIAIRPQKVTTLSTPLNPTGTTSTAGVMMGLSNLQASLVITPQITGNVHVTICGVVAQNTTADGATWTIRMGTGTAPTNGAALTGTAYGSVMSWTALTGQLKESFCITALVTGLTVGTAAWIDLSLAAVTGGTATMTSVAVGAFEL